MKRLSFRFSSFFLCFLIIFTIVFCDYKKVSAFEWSIPTVTWEIAAPFLFGLLGVMTVDSDFYASSEDEFLSYAETEGYTGPNVRAWIADVCSGTLDQASEIWTCFKSWVKDLVNKSMEVGSDSIDMSSMLSVVQYFDPFVTAVNTSAPDYAFTQGVAQAIYSSGLIVSYNIFLFDNSYSYSYTNSSINFTGNSSSQYLMTSVSIDYAGAVTLGVRSYTSASFSFTSSRTLFLFGVDSIPDSDYVTLLNPSDTTKFDSLSGINIDDLALLLATAISTAIPDVITLPWDKVGDTADSIAQTIEGLIELVQEGVLDISDYMQKIQDLLGVLVIDPVLDITIPRVEDPTTSEPITPEDVVQENISNSAFILKGIEKVFPFCLPYDLYNFVTLLVSEPVAPEIHYPIYDPTTGETLTIDIDFEEWESIVILFRYIFDFLFIIGLILIARALVGGGDKA